MGLFVPKVDPAQEALHAARARHLSESDELGIPVSVCSWLYGDYIEFLDDDHSTIASCSGACYDDPECHHWHIHVPRGRCALKRERSHPNGDALDFLCGSSSRSYGHPAANASEDGE